jgi:hypothetical protein
MKTKHTPGPWKINPRASLHIVSNDNKTIASCSSSQNGDNLETEQANARLIASAPDLLEALQTTKKFFDKMPKGQFGKIVCDIGLMNDMFIQMEMALKKAL